MPKYICEHCLEEARLTEKDMMILVYLSNRKGNPVDKWDSKYSKYSFRYMEHILKMGKTTFYVSVKKLMEFGYIEKDNFKVVNKNGRYPTSTFRLTDMGKSLLGVNKK